MLVKKGIILLCFLFPWIHSGQGSIEELLTMYNTESIPYVTIEDIKDEIDNIVVLDSREIGEYKVSHLKNAIYVGYDQFDITKVSEIPEIDKDTKIVVYCSLGIRSEVTSEKLKLAGYHNVYNLYGGIFEWINHGYPVFNSKEQRTDQVHPFSEEWEKWLEKGTKRYQE
ncbi:rhodanese-like domain-containing protein [Aquimarina spongiae]|uniref:Rhodanese-related sulfurtransferase n=1 Tax=Aquimarina spongiae TaxID=570521 RepID=A0A1M6KT70_9FLAO|nr:rhodanese-like domain-containing protein [Aquimarina spongiae]SHJ62096.1 Rhodanese-related sulfurtransferase [Aquimarina spongiae]